MKKYIIITIFVALVGCGTIKKWFGSEEKSEPKVEETFRPPLPGEIVENPDGTYTVVIKEELKNPDGTYTVTVRDDGETVSRPWVWLVSIASLVAVGFATRYYLNRK